MKKYFLINPEVAGSLGNNTIIDTRATPPLVSKLNYSFDGWLGDDLLESYPCFICTEKLAEKLKESNLTGYSLDICEITKSELFIDLYEAPDLPLFYWLKITRKENTDFILDSKGSLLVSGEALNVLSQLNIKHCIIESDFKFL